MDLFDINEYNFKAKHSLGLMVLAREKKTAMEMVDTFNKRFPHLPPYVPCKFGFERKRKTEYPPYEIEQINWEYMRKMKRE